MRASGGFQVKPATSENWTDYTPYVMPLELPASVTFPLVTRHHVAGRRQPPALRCNGGDNAA